MTGTGKHKFVPAEKDVDEFFKAYSEPPLFGKHDRATFAANLQVFFDLTFDAYVFGSEDRKAAFGAWRKHIGTRLEAERYFDAVDSVHPYT